MKSKTKRQNEIIYDVKGPLNPYEKDDSIKKDIEEIFDLNIQDHSLYLYATTKKKK